MATLSFHRPIMGKVIIGIYCYLIADILRNVLQNVSFRSLPNTLFQSEPLNLIGCHGNWKVNVIKKYLKIISSEAIRGKSWNLAAMFITVASTKRLMYVVCYGNLNFPLAYNGKHCRYFIFSNFCLVVPPPSDFQPGQSSSLVRRGSSVGCVSAIYAHIYGHRFDPHVRQGPFDLVSDCSWWVIADFTCHELTIQIQIS